MKWFGLMTGILAAGSIAQAATEEVVAVVTEETVVEETSAEITVDYYSAYVWRGQVINSAAVVQPGISAELPFGLVLGAWGNMDATKKNDLAGKFNEVDLSAVYSLPIEGLVGVDLGIVNYLYPYHEQKEIVDGEEVTLDGTDDTTEINATVSFDVLLSPYLTISRDIDACRGYYANAGIGHSIELTDALALDLGASLGWGDKTYNECYFGPDDQGLNDLNFSVSPNYGLTENLSLGATFAYTVLVDDDVRDAAEEYYGYKDHFYAGLNLDYAF